MKSFTNIVLMIVAAHYIKSDCSGCTRFFKVNTLCGFDGVTYKNECYAKCNETGVKHQGACSQNTQPCGCPDAYVPVYDLQGNQYQNACVANCKHKVAIANMGANHQLNSYEQKHIPLDIREDPSEDNGK